MQIGYLGLGCNVGDRRANLQAAVDALPGHGVAVLASSSTYDTDPVGEIREQPQFLNACIRVQTELEPEALLDACKAVERELGRQAGGPRHGPRPIDVDLLLLGDVEHSSERLTLPHEQVLARRFVLIPLLELDFELTTPGGERLADVALGRQPAQDPQPRPVRGRAAALPGTAPQDGRAGGDGFRADRVGERGLADAGVAGDHEQAPAAGERVFEPQAQLGQLAITTDEAPRANAHAPSVSAAGSADADRLADPRRAPPARRALVLPARVELQDPCAAFGPEWEQPAHPGAADPAADAFRGAEAHAAPRVAVRIDVVQVDRRAAPDEAEAEDREAHPERRGVAAVGLEVGEDLRRAIRRPRRVDRVARAELVEPLAHLVGHDRRRELARERPVDIRLRAREQLAVARDVDRRQRGEAAAAQHDLLLLLIAARVGPDRRGARRGRAGHRQREGQKSEDRTPLHRQRR
ncbi:MAG: 2-amino-4-hydroxy-6-hydroxymethyldihydropteridine diphosphokinase [Actinobacteria bacterium]|nr:2-amino-4-hydroxy-6-hydroxymethyldihydropteridine diphosphokinase [Actinomycetota bacterium]